MSKPSGFVWAQVPKTPAGFVDYRAIPSAQVRNMLRESEVVRLMEEFKARQKWNKTPQNKSRCQTLYGKIRQLQRQLADNEILTQS